MKNSLKFISLIILLFLPLSCTAEEELTTIRITPTPEENEYEVYLLIGQSNMAGRGAPMTADDLKVMDGVWVLNGKDEPTPATNPLNIYSTVRKGESMQHIGPGTNFGKIVAKETGKKILLVVNALGDTSISLWQKTAGLIDRDGSIGKGRLQLYAEAVRRAKEGMKYGKLKGILWLQGEADRSDSKRASYMGLLKQLVSDLRADLGEQEVPFVAGELAYWVDKQPEFNQMLRTISDNIPNSDYISAEGAGRLVPAPSTDPHFSREGQLLLGTRYANKILEMNYNIKSH